jgi:hypothetical protein
MALPKINTPIFELTLPSNGKTIKYRPFLVKEQKILLMAMESDDQKAMMLAIKQIINNCAVDQIDCDNLPMFDLEYFFLRLRAKSIGEEIELNLRHPLGTNSSGAICEHATKSKLNLLEVEVHKSIEHQDKVIIDETSGIGVKFKYPTSQMVENSDIENIDNELDLATEAIINSIEYIFDKENIYKKEDSTKEELKEFIEGLSQQQFEQLSKFFDTMPKLKHTLRWKCSGCGYEDETSLEGLANFFV